MKAVIVNYKGSWIFTLRTFLFIFLLIGISVSGIIFYQAGITVIGWDVSVSGTVNALICLCGFSFMYVLGMCIASIAENILMTRVIKENISSDLVSIIPRT